MTNSIHRLTVLAGSVFLSSAAFGQLWYTGNADAKGAQLASDFPGNQPYEYVVYDDFTVTASGGWDVGSIFANVAFNGTAITTYDWEIRRGISTGNGGTLVASGATAATTEKIGTIFGLSEYTVTTSGLNIDLAPGTYWLGSAFSGTETDFPSAYMLTTAGAGGIGTPTGNAGTAYYNNPGGAFGVNFQPLTDNGDSGCSEGLIAAPAPEPASMTLLGLGIAGLVARRRRRA